MNSLGANKVLRRQRQSLNCEPCRKKKCRCDRQLPCNKCLRSKSERCTYAATPKNSIAVTHSDVGDHSMGVDAARRNGSSIEDCAESNWPSPPGDKDETTAHGGEWRISHLLNYLVQTDSAKATDDTAPISTSGGCTTVGSKEDVSKVPEMLETLQTPVRNIMVKTRYLSPSSWIYCCLLVPHILEWLNDKGPKQAEYSALFKESRQLYKQLTLQTTLIWNPGQFGTLLPERVIAESLMSAYLRTFETIYRVFHIPTLVQKHNDFWNKPGLSDNEIIIQLQLCYSLGALFSSDDFQLKSYMIQWVREAEHWLSHSAKPRPTLAVVQTMCLLTLAREHTQGTYGDKAYIQSGTLLRAAISIGLHRDPVKLPQISYPHAEMRRRTWATVLELMLDSCLDSGSPPLISLNDFDCKLPANLNDSQIQLEGDGHDVPTPYPSRVLTDSTLQIALGNLFLDRLAIARHANGIILDEKYEHTMKISAQYNDACRKVIKSLQLMQSELSPFQRRYFEMVITRYVFTLHIPYLTLATRIPQYLLSGKACIEAALNMAACALDTSPSHTAALNRDHDDFVRLSLNSSGANRSVIFQSLMIITASLTAMLKESQNSFLWPDSVRALQNPLIAEYLSILKRGAIWTHRRLEGGAAHNRDHIVTSMAFAGAEAMMSNANVEESLRSTVKKACMDLRDSYTSLLDVSNLSMPSDQTSPEEDVWDCTDLWLAQSDQLDFNFSYF